MTPLERYQQDLKRAGFHYDPAQAGAVEYTQRLYEALLAPVSPMGLWDRLLRRTPAPVRGLYFWGGVGRGKTYIVDSFYECLPFPEKRRLHFHRFMKGIHEALKKLPKSPDPLHVVADAMAREFRVLCLDEFHVHDIADAMLLSGLLEALFERGVILVTTSNIPVDELYKNGLQRDRFLPAISLLQEYTEVVELAEGTDYRLDLLEKEGTYHVVEPLLSAPILETHFVDVAPEPGQRHTVLNINQREIMVEALADDVVWFDFPAICETPRSATDYLEIASLFHTVLIGNIPRMGEGMDDVAKRFVQLIDALYDHRVKVVVTAAAAPTELYHGRYQQFAFERTASRLQEMGSHRYLAEAHRA